jgi:hypothetical protein
LVERESLAATGFDMRRERERERYMSVLGLLGVFLVMKREILTGGERGEGRERK